MGVCDVTVYICDSKNANKKNRCEGKHSSCENLLAHSDKDSDKRWNDEGISKWDIHEEMYDNIYSVNDLYNKIDEFIKIIKTSASRNQAILFLRILDLLLLEEGTHVCIWIAS